MRQSGRALFLVPVVYVAIILGLLFLQFSGGERVTRSVGALTLRASRGGATEDGSPIISSIDLDFEGLRFAFAEETGLIVESTSDVSDRLATGYEMTEIGFVIDFEDGYRLALETSSDPRELQIRLETDELRPGVREFSIPFSLEFLPEERSENTSFATIERENNQYYLTAPPDVRIDLRNEKLVLTPNAIGQTVRYVEAVEGDAGRIAELFQNPDLSISDAALAARIDAYIDAAYAGWAGSRYNSASMTWLQGEGFERFTEETLTAYLAEAWRRNEYERAFAEMRRARDLYPDELSMLSAPFLGNLQEIRAEAIATDGQRTRELRDRIGTGDTSVLQEFGLFRFAADRGGAALYDELMAFADGLALRSLDTRTAVGLLANLYLVPPPDARADQLALQAVDVIERSILSAIVETPAGFLIQSAPGQLDLYLTLVAGATLNEFGTSRSDPIITRIGRNLLVSALDQADAAGLMPATLVIRGESVEDGGGTVRPEQLYPVIAEADAYPQQLSLYRELGPGNWIWTIAATRVVSLQDESWQFELSYPRLRTHYVMIHGVPEFERMELFGQTWRNAPDFEIYSKGRHYDEGTQTLMIKYYDNSVTRPIRIFF